MAHLTGFAQPWRFRDVSLMHHICTAYAQRGQVFESAVHTLSEEDQALPQVRALLPLLRGADLDRPDPLFWQWSDGRAVRQGKWKGVTHGEGWELGEWNLVLREWWSRDPVVLVGGSVLLPLLHRLLQILRLADIETSAVRVHHQIDTWRAADCLKKDFSVEIYCWVSLFQNRLYCCCWHRHALDSRALEKGLIYYEDFSIRRSGWQPY